MTPHPNTDLREVYPTTTKVPAREVQRLETMRAKPRPTQDAEGFIWEENVTHRRASEQVRVSDEAVAVARLIVCYVWAMVLVYAFMHVEQIFEFVNWLTRQLTASV